MKYSKFYLILTCFFILIIFSSASIANEDINTNSTNQINLNNPNTSIQSIGETHTIDNSSYNQMNNPTIQTAINNAKSGDTILITGSEYVHCHFIINKKLNIISNVGTIMTPCPSNIQGSDGIGIFYISPEASGTLISGFILTNNELKSGTVNPYCIYINGASNIEINNCTIKETSNGPGIFINNSKNTTINNCIIEKSEKGIYLENCRDTTIKNNIIDSNYKAGIYVGANSNNLNIYENIIHANNYYGIYLGSVTNTVISSNKITENRDNPIAQRAEEGTGIFVDTTVTNLKILGNLFEDNGKYGIYDSYKFTNMNDQYVQIVNENYFITHTERAIFHASPQNTTTTVYVWSNYYSGELFCGGTCYEPGVLIGNHERDLIMSQIIEIKKGVYSVSFIRKDTGEIAKNLNAIDVIFFLNKKDNNPIPQSQDIYRIIQIKNGTAIADFRNETYLESGNTIIAVGPGYGIIENRSSGARPSQIFNVANDHIPKNESITTISGNSLIKFRGNNDVYKVLLTTENGPLANKVVTIRINNKDYNKTTNEYGEASMSINLIVGTYPIKISFNGDEDYKGTVANDTIVIKSTITGYNVTKYYRNGTQYNAKFVDSKGNILKNKKITFNINGVIYTRETDKQGLAKLTINLYVGTYILTGYNPQTNDYYSNIITVLPTITENNNLVKYYRNNSQYTVKLLNKQGIPVAKDSVTFNINGKFYNRISDSNGIAKLTINLYSGSYIITAQYKDFYISNTIKVLPIIESKNIEMSENNRIPFTAKLLDNTGKPAEGKQVIFNINGRFYNRTSDSDGIASLKIQLLPKTYIITSTYNGFSISNLITIKTGGKFPTTLTNNIKYYYNTTDEFSTVLKNKNTNDNLANQKIEFLINNKIYTAVTDSQGIAKIDLNLEAGNYNITTKYNGNNNYLSTTSTNTIVVGSEKIVGETNNEELQNIINIAKPNEIIKLTAPKYDNISIIINTPITLTTSNSILTGDKNKNIITLNVDGAIVNGFEMIANNNTAIEINGNDNQIINCTIKSNLDSKLIDEYNTGKITMPGKGIEIKNGENNKIIENEIYNFYQGIYLKNTNNNTIQSNIITKNNYGIEFGENVTNTLIKYNDINNNIGLIAMDVVEGPLGYGISMRKSGVNVSVINNNINNNYEGIFIDAKNCSGIIITQNSIFNNTIEGITFNENYTYSENAIQPIVENNAIYNNAKGPSMIILGEVSANPAGIYGPGEWEDSKKLVLGANWYGTNKYVTWGNETGAGTICPRISTTLITFNISLIEPGKYEIKFYNNETLATSLPDLTVYFTLNFHTDKQSEKLVLIHEGKGTVEFDANNYYETKNVIEASSGSLNDINRKFQIIYTYNIPDSEIPK